jgi:group I intron endonuclease
MNSVLEDISGVVGHIYKITNTATNKCYVGQAMSHRKNKGKYKPFGFEGRFQDHISEAKCNTKLGSRYLNNAIRLYGKDVFTVVLLKTCSMEEIDHWETQYIAELNTLYPNGYNLTSGGRAGRYLATGRKNIDTITTNLSGARGGCICRTEATRELISKGIKEALKTESARDSLMKRAQVQHSKQKLERFRDVVIDLNNLDQYISSKHINGHLAAIVKVDDKKASFVGKYETLENLKERAKEFLIEISKTFATSSNCSGSP